MVDLLTLALTHVLIGLALLRLLARPGLEVADDLSPARDEGQAEHEGRIRHKNPTKIRAKKGRVDD